MSKVWLPPFETCCDQCKVIKVSIYRDATLHFGTECSVHGDNGIPSPFAKSSKIEYKIIVPEDLQKQERLFGDASQETKERKQKYFEEWKKKHETLEPKGT
jgi:hypothetical protein